MVDIDRLEPFCAIFVDSIESTETKLLIKMFSSELIFVEI